MAAKIIFFSNLTVTSFSVIVTSGAFPPVTSSEVERSPLIYKLFTATGFKTDLRAGCVLQLIFDG